MKYLLFLLLCLVPATSYARYGSSQYGRYVRQQQQVYQAQAKAFQEAMIRQQAINKAKFEAMVKARKVMHDKEDAKNRELIQRRKDANEK